MKAIAKALIACTALVLAAFFNYKENAGVALIFIFFATAAFASLHTDEK